MLDALGWAAFGWMASFFLLIAGYYVFRYRIRRHPQSLFIAALALGWPLFGASVIHLLPYPAGLTLMVVGAAFATMFIFLIVDEFRRGKVKSPSHPG